MCCRKFRYKLHTLPLSHLKLKMTITMTASNLYHKKLNRWDYITHTHARMHTHSHTHTHTHTHTHRGNLLSPVNVQTTSWVQRVTAPFQRPCKDEERTLNAIKEFPARDRKIIVVPLGRLTVSYEHKTRTVLLTFRLASVEPVQKRKLHANYLTGDNK